MTTDAPKNVVCSSNNINSPKPQMGTWGGVVVKALRY
jgi:hypothetical protein